MRNLRPWPGNVMSGRAGRATCGLWLPKCEGQTRPCFAWQHIMQLWVKKDSAFAVLAQSYKNRDVLIAGLNVDPRLDPLRSDPRLKQLVQRVGFK